MQLRNEQTTTHFHRVESRGGTRRETMNPAPLFLKRPHVGPVVVDFVPVDTVEDELSRLNQLSTIRQSLAPAAPVGLLLPLEMGIHDGELFVVHRLVAGQTIDQSLASGQRVNPERTAALVRELSRLVGYCHGLDEQHGHIVASSVILGTDNVLYLSGLTDSVSHDQPPPFPSLLFPRCQDLFSLLALTYRLRTGTDLPKTDPLSAPWPHDLAPLAVSVWNGEWSGTAEQLGVAIANRLHRPFWHRQRYIVAALGAVGVAAAAGFWLQTPTPTPPNWRTVQPSHVTAADASFYQQDFAHSSGHALRATGPAGVPLSLIPPGTFVAGTDADTVARMLDDITTATKPQPKFVLDSLALEIPRRVVSVAGFYMGTTEITVDQWQRFRQATGFLSTAEQDGTPGGTGRRDDADGVSRWIRSRDFNWNNSKHGRPPINHPVRNITRVDANAFCKWLSDESGDTYRLPTSIEWEYACRAGSQTSWWLGDSAAAVSAAAVVGPRKIQRPDAVATCAPNPWGLFDTIGNVEEWTSTTIVDRAGTSRAILRSGTFTSLPWKGRSASAKACQEHVPHASTGFRVVRELPASDD